MGGVYPSARPEPAPELARGLGEAGGLFVKGLINQSFGFGIGAFGYYRRVAEDIIERLLEQLRDYAAEAELKELVVAIDEAKKQRQAAERIRIVHPLIPKILRPGGQDPLGTVFGALSEGLHGGTDEACLDEADALRVALEFLIVKLNAIRRDAEAVHGGAEESAGGEGQAGRRESQVARPRTAVGRIHYGNVFSDGIRQTFGAHRRFVALVDVLGMKSWVAKVGPEAPAAELDD